MGSETFHEDAWATHSPRALYPLGSPAGAPQGPNPGKSPDDVVHPGQVPKHPGGWKRRESKSGVTHRSIPGKHVFMFDCRGRGVYFNFICFGKLNF